MQGLVVVPLFAGYDEDAGSGRIFSYDVAGGRVRGAPVLLHRLGVGLRPGRAEEALPRRTCPVADAVLACMQALYDAADDDSATGGPDLTRRIFPVVATITADGFSRLPDAETEQVAEPSWRSG